MEERLRVELEQLRVRHPDLRFVAEGRWVQLPAYPVADEWTPSPMPVAFSVPIGYPGTPPDNFCVPAEARYGGQTPNNWGQPSMPPPFPGSWMQFSWHVEAGDWKVTADPRTGGNLVVWVAGFAGRFREGA
jgi:hypothetical protein